MPRPRRNFYVVLGISPDASADAVRAAYRDLAKRYHPDRFGPTGASRFHEVAEAYQVLSDPESRRAHNDELGFEAPREFPTGEPLVHPLRVEAEPLVAEPISIRGAFHTSRPSVEEEFFDWTVRHFTGTQLPKSGRWQKLHMEVVLSPDEAEIGVVLPIRVPAFSPCRVCGGTGRVWSYRCLECHGEGIVEEMATLRMRIPGMVRDGTVWEVPVLEAGLYIRVRIRVDSA